MLLPSRRRIVAWAAAVPVALNRAWAGTRQLGAAPLISVQDFEQYPSILTPVADFYVRNHFAMPSIERSRWRVAVTGSVRKELNIALTDLEHFPQSELSCVVECAGNGVGVGAVGCAKWGGVRLSDLLRASGPVETARWLRITGEDRGTQPDLTGEIPYSRLLSMDVAIRAETIVALRMNGEALTDKHGAPARIVAAGRYGMDSVKWLTKIEVLEKPEPAFFMDHRFRRVHSAKLAQPVGAIAVKSVIVQPAANASLRGDRVQVGGYAWAGDASVERLVLRVNGGQWEPARFWSKPKPLEWVAWRWEFRPVRPGRCQIEARAFTASGEKQPEVRDDGREDAYELNQIQRVQFFWRP